MFLLVPAHPGFPGQIPQSRKTVVCCVCVFVSMDLPLCHWQRSIRFPFGQCIVVAGRKRSLESDESDSEDEDDSADEEDESDSDDNDKDDAVKTVPVKKQEPLMKG